MLLVLLQYSGSLWPNYIKETDTFLKHEHCIVKGWFLYNVFKIGCFFIVLNSFLLQLSSFFCKVFSYVKIQNELKINIHFHLCLWEYRISILVRIDNYSEQINSSCWNTIDMLIYWYSFSLTPSRLLSKK